MPRGHGIVPLFTPTFGAGISSSLITARLAGLLMRESLPSRAFHDARLAQLKRIQGVYAQLGWEPPAGADGNTTLVFPPPMRAGGGEPW